MKKIKIKSAIALIALFALSSCQKSLDLYPFNSIELSQSFKSVQDAATWNNGLYNDLRGRTYGTYVVSQDVQADQLNASLDFGNRNGNPHRWGQSFLADDGVLSGTWSGYYFALRNLNSAIAGFEGIPTTSPAQVATMNRYKGDNYLARAHYYHQLVKRFAKPFEPATAAADLGVPLVLTYDLNAQPARATVKQVYDQILSDITLAKSLLSTVSGTQGAVKFTADAASALEARVKLDMQDWAGAIAAANTVISSNRYPLITTSTELRSMWVNDFSKEVIFRCAVVKQTEQPNTNAVYLGFNAANAKFTPDFIPSQWVINSYDATDLRKAIYFGVKPVIIQGINYPTMTLVDKFPGNPLLFTTAATNYQHSPIVFRVAELYLILAEAGSRAGGASAVQANTVLNQLRDARGLASITVSGTSLIQEVRDERTRELAFEGFRLWDLKRWHLGFIRRSPQDINAINVGANYNTLSIVADDNQFTWGVPTNDKTVNPNIVQNPGW